MEFELTDYNVDVLQNGYKILQNPKSFCYGIDAVLLADFICKNEQKSKKEKIVDLGTGNAIIPLLLVSRLEKAEIEGLEIQKEAFSMAEKSIFMNELENRIKIINGDIKKVSENFTRNIYDAVCSNPPYMIDNHGKQNPDDSKKIARHEILCTLEDVIKSASYLLGSRGRFYMIHRPFRLSETFVLLSKYNLEPKIIRFVVPYQGKEPTMFLIKAVKAANPRLTVEGELAVYKDKCIYSDEVQGIYEGFRK